MNTEMITHKEFKQALHIVEAYIQQTQEIISSMNITDDTLQTFDETVLLHSKIVDQSRKLIGWRTCRLIHYALGDYGSWDKKVYDLKNLTKSNLLKQNGAGKTVIRETENLCRLAGFELKD